jgi:hypothetical protein
MNWEDWLAASQPKIQGTWNLHNAFLSEQPDNPLDFFFLFSSTAATGGWDGQANYHAGNTFVESFAAYRQQLGLAGSALSVGFIRDAGFVAENEGVADVARAMGQWFNTEPELVGLYRADVETAPIKVGGQRLGTRTGKEVSAGHGHAFDRFGHIKHLPRPLAQGPAHASIPQRRGARARVILCFRLRVFVPRQAGSLYP